MILEIGLMVFFGSIAYAEVTLVLAYLFRSFRMKLKPTELKYEDMFTLRMVNSSVLVDFEALEG